MATFRQSCKGRNSCGKLIESDHGLLLNPATAQGADEFDSGDNEFRAIPGVWLALAILRAL